MSTPEDVLEFWLDEVGPEGWYASSDELDALVRDRHLQTWERATQGALSLWLTYPSGALAYLILTDQFPRNMFRGTHKAFAMDPAALAVSKIAIGKDWDLKIDEPARQFFYMPLMHSECVTDQERSVRLFKTRMTKTGDPELLHPRAHRDVIRKFGRFPYRNEALSRPHTEDERAFIETGGYRSVLQSMSA